MNLPKIKTLEEAYKEYLNHSEPVNFPIPENMDGLDPSELNRLYTLVSSSDGSINKKYLRDLQNHINSLPPRPALRVHYNIEQLQELLNDTPETTIINPNDPNAKQTQNNLEKNKLPRSRLIDQFYSHQLPGIQSPSLTQIRKIIDDQKFLRDSAKNCTELLKIATKKLAEAFPDSSSYNIAKSHSNFQEDDQNSTNYKILKCPLRYMESSIAIVLEHTEHISIDIQREEFENVPE